MKRMLWIVVVLFWARCASSPDESLNSSSVLVDLGDEGNGEAINAYNSFDASRCGNATTAVLAFKKFGGGQRNATQDGAEELVRTSQPTAEVDRQAGESFEEEGGIDEPIGTELPSGDEYLASPETWTSDGLSLTASDVDVDVVEIDGEATCVVRAPVNLYSPAIARKLAEQGTIQNFYMTGQRSGEGIVEEGATNTIDTRHEFYDADGQRINQRTSSRRIDENADPNQTVSSSFDRQAISDATGIRAASGARLSNDYICNATTYVLSQQGELAYLPGLTFRPLPNPVRTGFVHVPDTASAQEVAQIMRRTIAADRAARTAH